MFVLMCILCVLCSVCGVTVANPVARVNNFLIFSELLLNAVSGLLWQPFHDKTQAADQALLQSFSETQRGFPPATAQRMFKNDSPSGARNQNCTFSALFLHQRFIYDGAVLARANAAKGGTARAACRRAVPSGACGRGARRVGPVPHCG